MDHFHSLVTKLSNLDHEDLLIIAGVTLLTSVAYLFLSGHFPSRRSQQRRVLSAELEKAKRKVDMLQQQLDQTQDDAAGDKEVRVWMDGAFDLMHYGHANAFRQGRALGTHLIVGVNSDESITACKGPPVMNDAERQTAVSGCKFVDEMVLDVPYVMNEEYLQYIIKKYRIDLVVHGDDPCIVDGKDVYANSKAVGIYRSIPRTEGISTTDIVGRMLLMTKQHHSNPNEDSLSTASDTESDAGVRLGSSVNNAETGGIYHRHSTFHTTAQMLRTFSTRTEGCGLLVPESQRKVVYIHGAFDMFNAGHVHALRLAKEMGNYLLVGVLDDEEVNRNFGYNRPILNLNERVLSVTSCKYVDDVVIAPPYQITEQMIASLKMQVVLHAVNEELPPDPDAFAVPKHKGIYREIENSALEEQPLAVDDIVQRIWQNEDRFKKKYEKKQAAEGQYYKDRYNATGAK